MLHRSACFARYRAPTPLTPPLPPQHTGCALTIGETVLLRRPDSWQDVLVELRGIDKQDAVIFVRDHFEIVQLSWLRRR
jgi:hypothetical protein